MDELSFEDLYATLCNHLEAANKIDSISKQFNDITTDQDRVSMAYTHLRECDMLYNKQKSSQASSKSAEKSTQVRNEGNKAHGNGALSEALLLYTESIALAPYPATKTCSSEELALAFANRSAVLYAIKQYKLCLSDIQQAIKYKYPTELQYKVLERKGNCLQLMGMPTEAGQSFQAALDSPLPQERISAIEASLQNLCINTESCKYVDTKTSESWSPQKTYGENPQIPCASDCLRIQFSTDMGRFVEATRDIKAGDILLIEEPYAAVLLPQHHLTHCWNCIKRCAALIPCHNCSLVMYCDEQCRSSAWQAHHQIECSVLPKLYQLNLGGVALLALRIVMVASKSGKSVLELYQEIQKLELANNDDKIKGFNSDGRYVSSDYKTIYNLIGHTESRTVGDLYKRAVKAAHIINCLETYSDIFSYSDDNETVPDLHMFLGGVLLRHLQSMPCNAHSISELNQVGQQAPETTELGCGSYATLSLINHSCEPNVAGINRSGSEALLMAVRPIKKGEQILNDYGFHYALQCRQDRSLSLRMHYFFTCQCEACIENWPLYKHLQDKNPTYLCFKCRSPLLAHSHVRSRRTLVRCGQCGEKNNVFKHQQKLKVVWEMIDNIYTKIVLHRSKENFVDMLSQHLEFLDASVQRPYKLYNYCQEMLNECVQRTGNKHMT